GGGHKTFERRREAWAFLLSGGAVYNNLDPSFATDDPTGSGQIQQPDGCFDGRELRKQLHILHTFMDSLDFVRMQPDRNAAAIPPPRLRPLFTAAGRRANGRPPPPPPPAKSRVPACCWICPQAGGGPIGCPPPRAHGSRPRYWITPAAGGALTAPVSTGTSPC